MYLIRILIFSNLLINIKKQSDIQISSIVYICQNNCQNIKLFLVFL